jgi:hypothetical protein
MMNRRTPLAVGLCAFLALSATASTASAQQVLLIWDTNAGCTPQLKSALEAAGMTVTLSQTSEDAYNGANPSPNAFDAVIHLNGTTYDTDMPAAGQAALVNYVENIGGGFIHTEWNAYELDRSAHMQAMTNLTLFVREDVSNGTGIYTVVPGQESHPVLDGLPATFDVSGVGNGGPMRVFAQSPATLLMTDGTYATVAVREWMAGRIVGFAHAGNYANQVTLCDADTQRLFVNAVNWAGLLPRAQDSSATTAEDTASAAIPLSAIDPLGGTLTYAIVTPPTNGTLSGTGASRVYTPNANFNGADSFQWSATNARGTRVITVNITVTPVNDAPVATNVTATTADDHEQHRPLRPRCQLQRRGQLYVPRERWNGQLEHRHGQHHGDAGERRAGGDQRHGDDGGGHGGRHHVARH